MRTADGHSAGFDVLPSRTPSQSSRTAMVESGPAGYRYSCDTKVVSPSKAEFTRLDRASQSRLNSSSFLSRISPAPLWYTQVKHMMVQERKPAEENRRLEDDCRSPISSWGMISSRFRDPGPTMVRTRPLSGSLSELTKLSVNNNDLTTVRNMAKLGQERRGPSADLGSWSKSQTSAQDSQLICRSTTSASLMVPTNLSAMDMDSKHKRNSFSVVDSRTLPQPSRIVNYVDCIKPVAERRTQGYAGLQNMGNSCFMNSIVQCLTFAVPLRDHLLHGTCVVNPGSRFKGRILEEFRSLNMLLWAPGATAVVPTTFWSELHLLNCGFTNGSQQDAQEFLSCLLHALHEELCTPRRTRLSFPIIRRSAKSSSPPSNESQSIVKDLFMGQLRTVLTCSGCKNEKVSVDPFWELSLPIPSQASISKNPSTLQSVGSGPVTLQRCIELFTRPELLFGENQLKCDRCCNQRLGYLQCLVQQLPRLLVIQLKRFADRKISQMVKLTQKIEIHEIESGVRVLRLFAVCCHVGTLDQGHYTAYCWDPKNDTWIHFNDKTVKVVNVEEVLSSSSAYLMFYEHV